MASGDYTRRGSAQLDVDEFQESSRKFVSVRVVNLHARFGPRAHLHSAGGLLRHKRIRPISIRNRRSAALWVLSSLA